MISAGKVGSVGLLTSVLTSQPDQPTVASEPTRSTPTPTTRYEDAKPTSSKANERGFWYNVTRFFNQGEAHRKAMQRY